MGTSFRPFASLAVMAFALTACSVLPERTAQREGSSVRTTTAPAQASTLAVSRSPAVQQCLSGLGSAGAAFTPLPDRYTGQGCSNLGTVQLTALAGDRDRFAVSNLGPVTCNVSAAFAGWARFGVDRAAQQILGSSLSRIETFGSYSCRNVAGSRRRSAHATADAIDISAFVLADGRRISVQDHWNGGTRAEREFLRVVQQSACKRFGTVLGPEYNAAHRDHLHVEGVSSGNSYCR